LSYPLYIVNGGNEVGDPREIGVSGGPDQRD
jgi:hypothetical protein